MRLGLRLWELVNRNSPTLALRQAAMPFMEDIQQVLNQNVNLAVLDGWEALFVERLSRRGLRGEPGAGRRPDAGPRVLRRAGADGPPAAVRSRRSTSTQFADPAGKVTAGRLSARCSSETAHQGFAQLAGVVDPDTWGIAVPVLDGQAARGGRARRRGPPAGDAAAGAGARPADRRPGHRAGSWRVAAAPLAFRSTESL